MSTCSSCGADRPVTSTPCPRCGATNGDPGQALPLHERPTFKRAAVLIYATICATTVFAIERTLPLTTLLAIPLGVATGFWIADRRYGRMGFDQWMLPVLLGTAAAVLGHAVVAGVAAAADRALFFLILSCTGVVVSHLGLFGGLALWYTVRGRPESGA